MNGYAASNSLFFCFLATASTPTVLEAFVVRHGHSPLANYAKSTSLTHEAFLTGNTHGISTSYDARGNVRKSLLNSMSSALEDVPDLSEKSNSGAAAMSSLEPETQGMTSMGNEISQINSTIASIANLAIAAQEHSSLLPETNDVTEEELMEKQEQIAAAQLLAAVPQNTAMLQSNLAEGPGVSTTEVQGPFDAPQSFFETRENATIIPTAAELVMAAEEGFIIPTNVLTNEFDRNDATEETQDLLPKEESLSLSAGLTPPVTSPAEETDLGSAVSSTDDEETVESPGVRKILKFALPAIGVWLCGPILSLIDTASVGLLAGTAHQAALSPAVAITDYGALLMAFMYTGTTNLIASAKETDKNDATMKKTAKTLVAAMQLSVFVGAVLGVGLLGSGKYLLKGIIGNDTVDPLVFRTALKYVRIRALGMPAAALIGSAQAACLGMQDIKSPLYVLLAAAVVNFFGDLVLVGQSNPWIGGAPGAAWATVFSQYAAMALFTLWLTMKPRAKQVEDEPKHDVNSNDGGESFANIPTFKVQQESERKPVINLTKAILDKTSPLTQRFPVFKNNHPNFKVQEVLFSAAGKLRRLTLSARLKQLRGDGHRSEDNGATFSTRGFLHGRLKPGNLMSLPPKATAREFLPYVVPVTTTSAGRVSAYVAMSHVVSSCLGTMAMAAQQVIVSIFYCLCPVADALNLTAQSLIPSLFEKKKSKERANALRKAAVDFLAAGGLFGGFLVGAVACIPMIARLFTSDVAVVAQVNSVVPLLAISFMVHGAICAMEGVMLGQRDLGFLGKTYGFYFVAVPLFMLRIKRAVLQGVGATANLTSVWRVFAGYQLVRFAMFVSRVIILTRRTNREAVDLSRGTIQVLDDTGLGELGKSLTEIDGVPLEPTEAPKEIITNAP